MLRGPDVRQPLPEETAHVILEGGRPAENLPIGRGFNQLEIVDRTRSPRRWIFTDS